MHNSREVICGIDSCPNYTGLCIALRLQDIACPHETPLRVLCYRLGREGGSVERGGANLFAATCIPVDAPSALLYFLVGCAQGAQVEQVQRRSDGTLGRDDAH